MSPHAAPARHSHQRRAWRPRRPSLLMVTWLTAVWVLLWGDLTWGNVIMGCVLALAVTLVLPLPRVPVDVRVRPWALARLMARFMYDVMVASVQVAGFALGRRTPRGAVIRVRLHSHSDVFLYLTSGFTSLVPGSVVVEAHRLTGTMYVHVFDVHMQGGLEGAEQAILAQEERILRAFASDEQLREAGFHPGSTPRAGKVAR